MRLLVVNDTGMVGGAAVSATRLCQALRRRGHTIGMITRPESPPASDACDEHFPLVRGDAVLEALPGRLLRRARVARGATLAQRKWREDLRRILWQFRPDLIHLHNIHGGRWEVDLAEACCERAPVLWTLHDLWPVTGSCAYPFQCGRFATHCDASCPQVGTYPTVPRHRIWQEHERRLAFFASGRPAAMTGPTHYVGEIAMAATRGQIPVRVISNATPLDAFQPSDQGTARGKLGMVVGPEEVVVATSAANLHSPFKRLGLLLDALRLVPEQSFVVLAVGRSEAATPGVPPNVRLHPMGYVAAAEELARIYAAADLYAQPALQETQGMVLMEAMACGTPCVAPAVGGIPETVGEAGWLAAEATPEALAAAFRRALAARADWPERGQQASLDARQRFGIPLMANRFEALMEGILSGALPSQDHLDSQPVLETRAAGTS